MRLPLRHSGPRRCGFTLVEMLVALAVLSLTLSVVGVVFAITARTASQAQAHSEVNTYVEQFLTQIRADLRQCEPSKSILVMVGRTQAAALTSDDLEAQAYHRVQVSNDPNVTANFDPLVDSGADPASNGYSDPRADILMFFTSRACKSLAPPTVAGVDDAHEAARQGAKFTPVQVVYGHASFDTPNSDGDGFSGNLRHITPGAGMMEMSDIPASAWHLSRRQALVYSLTGDSVLSTEFNIDDRIDLARCFTSADNRAADVIELDFEPYLAEFPPATALWNPYGLLGSTYKDWNNEPYIRDILYRDGDSDSDYHVTTVADSVPVAMRSNMGVQLLPGCAWFQVEFLMPEDPRNSLAFSPDLTAGLPADYSLTDDQPRWMSVEPGETYVFVPDTQENRDKVMKEVAPSGAPLADSRLESFGRLDQGDVTDPSGVLEQRNIRMWPYAIRVTIRVWDDGGRLERPLVRSLVHWFE